MESKETSLPIDGEVERRADGDLNGCSGNLTKRNADSRARKNSIRKLWSLFWETSFELRSFSQDISYLIPLLL